MKERARLLRKNQTKAETQFWNIVRKRQFHGFKFHRQYELYGYILDFVCFQKLLIIEFDGYQHLDNREYDMVRDTFFKEREFSILRFWNNELFQSQDIVLEKIYQKLISLPDSEKYSSRSK